MTNLNQFISTITITKNNNKGLFRTLNSLSNLNTKPLEVIVVNGNPEDSKIIPLIDKFKSGLIINFVNESDEGIYDAMNKGRNLAKANLIHYLNAGDEVHKDIYKNVNATCLLPVKIIDEVTGYYWYDKPKLFGFSYCHQGIIFESNHEPYNLNYKIVSDFNTIVSQFPNGLSELKINNNGYVTFYLGGISSQKAKIGNFDIIKIIWKNLTFTKATLITFIILIKFFIPRFIRRLLMHACKKNHLFDSTKVKF